MKNRKTNHQRPPRGIERPLGSVACRECGVRRQSLGPHIRSVHGMSAHQYRKKHPGASTVCHELWVKRVHGGVEGNERLRRLGYKHLTQRRFFRDPARVEREQGRDPRKNTNKDAGTAPDESGEPQAVHEGRNAA